MLAIEPKAQIASSTKSSWPHLDETVVFKGIDDLKKNPNLINQGALGLCGEATFFHHVLQRRPIVFSSMAKLLFMDGIGFIGDLVIKPDDDLLNANYGTILAANPGLPPQTDWMVVSSLRDTENEFLDFQGTPQEDWADSSNIAERWWWYQRSKLYTSVQPDLDTDLAHVKTSILKTTRNHIALRIKVAMIQAGTGRHVISLESPLIFDETNDKVTFDYWTWGHDIKSTDDLPDKLTITKFSDNYLGATIAKF